MFDRLKEKFFGGATEPKMPGISIAAPCAGKAVALSAVPDPMFGEEMLGKGAAILPTKGKFYAPADGVIAIMFETCHAVSMVTDSGAEILIHVGLDTVELKGKFFTPHVTGGDKVKKGDLLLEADLDGIRAQGYNIITPVIICNTPEFAAVAAVPEGEVRPGELLLTLTK